MIALDAIYNLELLYIKILTLWCEVKNVSYNVLLL